MKEKLKKALIYPLDSFLIWQAGFRRVKRNGKWMYRNDLFYVESREVAVRFAALQLRGDR